MTTYTRGTHSLLLIVILLPQRNSYTLRRPTEERPTLYSRRALNAYFYPSTSRTYGAVDWDPPHLAPVFFVYKSQLKIRVHLFEAGGRVFHRYLEDAVPGAC